jgi:glycosyltransferase involved in cell wall biosynthesis
MNSLKILQLGMHERGSGGGVECYFWDLFDSLRADPELRVDAVYFQHRATQPPPAPNQRCIGSTGQPGYRRLWNLRQAVLPELKSTADQPSVVASHFALYAAALLPRLSRMPHVVHFHGPWAIESAVEGRDAANVFLKRMVERAVYSSATAFIALSQSFKDLLVKEYRVDPELVHIIPGAVDVRRFCPGDKSLARARLGWPKDTRILFCLRRLVRRMGLKNLLDAFCQIAESHSDVMLIIGGTGPLRGELEKQINDRGLSDRVRLTGFVPNEDLVSAYRAADLAIFPSQALEGFGSAAVEAMSSGTPILVTPVGGLPELVNGLASQLVLRDRGTEVITEWLDQFLSGKIALPTAEECHRHVQRNFTWSIVARQILTLYRNVATAQKSEERSGFAQRSQQAQTQ